jgi:hypothetical protein
VPREEAFRMLEAPSDQKWTCLSWLNGTIASARLDVLNDADLLAKLGTVGATAAEAVTIGKEGPGCWRRYLTRSGLA